MSTDQDDKMRAFDATDIQLLAFHFGGKFIVQGNPSFVMAASRGTGYEIYRSREATRR